MKKIIIPIILLIIIIVFPTLYSYLIFEEESYIVNEVESKPENIEVFFYINHINTSDGKIKFNIETNLPNGMQLILTLRNNRDYTAQAKVTVQNGEIISPEFTNHGGSLERGNYDLKISSSAASLYSEDIKKWIGTSGEFMIGKYIKYDSLFECNLIEAIFEVVI